MAQSSSPSSASVKHLVQILSLDNILLVEIESDKPVTLSEDGWGEIQVIVGKELFVLRIPEQGAKIQIVKTNFIGD